MLYKLLVLLHPFFRIAGRSLAVLLLLASFGLVVYAAYYENAPWVWFSCIGTFLACLLVTLLCTFYNWWLFKLRPRGALFMPFD